MAVTKYKVRLNHASGVVRVEGLLVKVVKKPDVPSSSGDRFRRSICDSQPGALFTGPPAYWELTLKLPKGAAKKGVVAYDIEVVMLNAANEIVDSYCVRRKKPRGIVLPPILIPRPTRKPGKS